MICQIEAAKLQRVAIKDVAGSVLLLREGMVNDEAIANVMLACRHLEDASMRLGKAIQALDGGTSVYDKETTAGAK